MMLGTLPRATHPRAAGSTQPGAVSSATDQVSRAMAPSASRMQMTVMGLLIFQLFITAILLFIPAPAGFSPACAS